jgi:hypothetical protein
MVPEYIVSKEILSKLDPRQYPMLAKSFGFNKPSQRKVAASMLKPNVVTRTKGVSANNSKKSGYSVVPAHLPRNRGGMKTYGPSLSSLENILKKYVPESRPNVLKNLVKRMKREQKETQASIKNVLNRLAK